MKLWVFGDSYSIGSSFKHENLWHYDENWIDIVAGNLSIDQANIENFSQFGVSNDYIFKTVIENYNNFSIDDCVIIQLTGPNRKWFFPNDPSLSNFVSMREGNHPKQIQTALDYYIRHLQNDQLDDIQYTAYVYSIQYMMLVKPGIKFLVVPGFADYPGVTGNLTEHVCDAEFSSSEVLSKFYKKTGWDPRLNHMTMDNHRVLASKVANYFKTNQPIDLTTGFKSNIYT